jgi:hypothetical protein
MQPPPDSAVQAGVWHVVCLAAIDAMWHGHKYACVVRTQLRQLFGSATGRQCSQGQRAKLHEQILKAGFQPGDLVAGAAPNTITVRHHQLLATAGGNAATARFRKLLGDFVSLQCPPATSTPPFTMGDNHPFFYTVGGELRLRRPT